MSRPELPGYYFDESRNKYFKITNGSLVNNSNYHNNLIQSKKRKLEYSKKQSRVLSKHINKYKSLLNKIIAKRYENTSVNLMLGNLNFNDYSLYSFELLRNNRFSKAISFPNSFKILKVLNDENKIAFNDYHSSIKIVSISGFLDKEIHNNLVFMDFKIDHYLNNLLLKGYNLTRPEISTISIDKGTIFKSIRIKEIDLNYTINFIKFERMNNQSNMTDLSVSLIKYVKLLSQSKLKKKLIALFGINLITVGGNSYDYEYKLIDNSDYYINYSVIIENNLLIGSNKGDIINIKFNLNFGIDDIYYFKIPNNLSISKIFKFDNFFYISYGSSFLILNYNFKLVKSIKYKDFIKNFFILNKKIFLIVGIKKISIVHLIDQVVQFKNLPYFNDNIINQISKTFNNNLIINESDSVILVYNLVSLDFFKVNLKLGVNEKLTDFFMVREDLLIFQVLNNLNNDSKFMIYNI